MQKNKKSYLIIIFLSLSIIFVIILISLKLNKNISYNKNITIKISDLVPKTIEYKRGNKTFNSKIEFENINIEDDRIYYSGNYKGKFTIDNKEYEATLNVIDDISPIIKEIEPIKIYKNESIDLLKLINVTDNSHDKLEITVNGNYDNTKIGEYELEYVVKDKGDNTSIKKFKLIVREKEVNKNNDNYIAGTTSKGYKIEVINGVYYINGILIVNKTYNLPITYNPGNLLQELNIAFEKLKNNALKDGYNIFIVSGYRSYSAQKNIYNNYVNRDGKSIADTYSARPGHSEHQSGLAIDVNSLYKSFADTPEGKWLNDNCYKYGFIIRYPKGKEDITGYMFEPWHLRYVGVDLAKILYNDGNWITLEEYLGINSKYK